MSDEFEQFEKYDPKAAEERMKHGGLIPPGKYRATLLGAKRTESKAKQTPGWEMTFKLSEGGFAGSEVTDTIYITDNVKSKDRLVIFGHRLGLLIKKPDGTGYVKAEGKTDFMDCLDTPCIIEVIHEPDQKDENKKWVRLAFGGVYLPNDPEAVKTLGKAKEPEKKGATAAADAKKGDEAKPEKKKVGRGEL
ncbi:unnamed protein product [Gemmataceae bacterium]|nr:unnamed protein product [Gemmataceae bacterium]VTU01038.1 unnamed protein product [Gemmataceae bacterium]